MIKLPAVTYDPEADAIGLYFGPPGAQYVESEEVSPGLVLDYDDNGRVIGAQLLYVSQLLAKGAAKGQVIGFPANEPRAAE